MAAGMAAAAHQHTALEVGEGTVRLVATVHPAVEVEAEASRLLRAKDLRLELTLSMYHDLVYVSLSTIYARLLTKCSTLQAMAMVLGGRHGSLGTYHCGRVAAGAGQRGLVA